MESRNPGTRWWCVTYRRVPADTPRSGGAVHVAHHPHGIRGGCRLPEKARWPVGRDRGTRRVLSGSSCQRRPSIPAVPATSVHDLCAHFETVRETMTAGGMERELLRPILAVRRRLVAPSMAPCGRDGAAGACRPRRRGAPLSQPPPAPPSRHPGPGMCASPSSPVPRGLSLCGLSPLASGEKPYRGRLAARVQPDDARHVCLSGHKA